MSGFLGNLILVNISTAIIIGVFILMRQVLKSKIHTAVLCTLWTLIFVRMLVPVQLETDFSFLDNSPVTEAYTMIESIDYFAPADMVAKINTAPIIDTANEVHAVNTNNTSPAGNINIPLILYAVGAAIALVYILSSNIAFGRYIRRVDMPMELTYADKAVFEQQGIKQLKVYFAQRLKSPCLYGIFSPKILLNETSIANDKVRRYSLFHETTHYKHKDNIWLAVGLAACVVNWFNPMMWLGLHLSKKDREVYCDERVIKQIGESEAVDYGKSLLMIALNRRSKLLTVSTTMTGGRKEMKQRIKNIAGDKKAWIIVSAVVVIFVAGLFAVTSIINSGTPKFAGEIEKIINPYDYHELIELFDSSDLQGVNVHEIFRLDIDGDGKDELYTNSSFGGFFARQFVECYDYKTGKYSNVLDIESDKDYKFIVYEDVPYIFVMDYEGTQNVEDFHNVYKLVLDRGKVSYSELDTELKEEVLSYVLDNVSRGILGSADGPTAIYTGEDVEDISIYDITSGEDVLICSVSNNDILEQFVSLFRDFGYVNTDDIEQPMKAVIGFSQDGVDMDITVLFGHEEYMSLVSGHLEHLFENDELEEYLYMFVEGNY